jgi:uncharacterized membrane protein YhfC
MVKSISIAFMIVSLLLSIGVPIIAAIYCRKKYKISFLNIIVGAGIFILFALVLEGTMNIYFLKTNFTTSTILDSNPWIYAIYGAFAAGIFEEAGRFLGFKLLLKGRIEKKDGIAYGIGHGGIEAIIIGGIPLIQSLYFSFLINAGTLNSSLGGKISKSILDQISSSLTNAAPYFFLISGVERLLAFSIQIGLSMVVLYGIKSRKYRYLLYAILIHALIDFPAALFQKGTISNVWIVEGICAVAVLISYFFVKNWDEIYKNNNM